jgi:hypothetical protein
VDSLSKRVLEALETGGPGTADEVSRRQGVGAAAADVAGKLENLAALHQVKRSPRGAYYVPGHTTATGQGPAAGASADPPRSRASAQGAAVMVGDELVQPGRAFTNAELMRTFGCSNSGGMRRSTATNTLLIISHSSGTRDKQPYDDKWQDGVLLYTAMGMVGDQDLTRGQNVTLAQSESNGVMCLLFESPEQNQYVFVGRVVLASAPVEGRQPDATGVDRRVWLFPLRLADPQPKGAAPEPPAGSVKPARSAGTPTSAPAQAVAASVARQERHWAWDGTVAEFLATQESSLIEDLEAHHKRCCSELPVASNYTAWRGSVSALRAALRPAVVEFPSLGRAHVVFEYELPRERGRRPDVVLLAGQHVIVLEFKEYDHALPPHIDQVEAYARDLSEYHAASHGRKVVPVLVPTKCRQDSNTAGRVSIVSAMGLIDSVREWAQAAASEPALDASEWLNSDYVPLPSLVSAARTIFNHEPLPHIRRAESAGIPDTLASLEKIEASARRTGTSHLALVTGVPGSGKTLVGLQYVYQTHFGHEDEQGAVFLSGNGPLVKVLQHTLKSRVFVQDVLGFLKTYGGDNQVRPREHVWVFDEAQRAFDADLALEKRGVAISEPEDFLRLSERLDSWGLMIGLIGQGQEIHRGEEAGLGQWNDALAAMDRPWTVHCPPALAPSFSAAAEVQADEHLGLDATLRSHRAEDVHLWVASLLSGDLASAKRTSLGLLDAGFGVYVTREIEAARIYVRERYRDVAGARYGLLASARDRSLAYYGFLNDWNYTKNLRVGPWFADSPDSKYSCCALRETATEFQCQGLELDMPIVGWGGDLFWTDRGWEIKSSRRSSLKNPLQIRLNAYRVLLTRGRDGFIVFVPPEVEFDATHAALVRAGCVHLEKVAL